MALKLAHGLEAIVYAGEGEYEVKILRVKVAAGDILVCPAAEATYLKRGGLFVAVGDSEALARAKVAIKAKEEERAKLIAEEAKAAKNRAEVAPAQKNKKGD